MDLLILFLKECLKNCCQSLDPSIFFFNLTLHYRCSIILQKRGIQKTLPALVVNFNDVVNYNLIPVYRRDSQFRVKESAFIVDLRRIYWTTNVRHPCR
jgi:hypothetical protein